MNKTEFLKQSVKDIRTTLQALFEDPDGEFVGMNKSDLKEFSKDNWDDIQGFLDTDDTVEEVEETPLDPEPSAEESPATENLDGDWVGDTKTNLHSGAPGRLTQRAGSRDLD